VRQRVNLLRTVYSWCLYTDAGSVGMSVIHLMTTGTLCLCVMC